MSPDTATCKACGAPIVWIRMEATGRAMPCDPAVFRVWLIALVDAEPAGMAGGTVMTLITDEGLVGTGIIATDPVIPFAAQWTGRQPHWASCPHGESFRRASER